MLLLAHEYIAREGSAWALPATARNKRLSAERAGNAARRGPKYR